MSFLKANTEELMAVAVIVLLLVTNVGDFIVGIIKKTLNYWDVGSLVATLAFIAFMMFVVKTK